MERLITSEQVETFMADIKAAVAAHELCLAALNPLMETEAADAAMRMHAAASRELVAWCLPAARELNRLGPLTQAQAQAKLYRGDLFDGRCETYRNEGFEFEPGMNEVDATSFNDEQVRRVASAVSDHVKRYDFASAALEVICIIVGRLIVGRAVETQRLGDVY